ncbi:hypothetical protein [Dictyoglomus thermophilum]|uniref:Uncharacterized protein n=2 Tax=Dictyoglomus thermophilum TaxID=14 RepID=B5YEH0_DICT6|nr:hypothetical protein [Dictyoglomus thermophilum]ACI19814.1 hypothetical protein DICTH_1079 [Dictyoglomus thermophilum H-6-12]MCX7721075.1 hypothetical protein [Dictyoglomus thermophilum]TYT22529.1 hypothetical protein FY122_07600 [Dictyoglomus thermophilum]
MINFPIYVVYIWKKDSSIDKLDLPIIAIGNPREIILLCQRILAPKSTINEFFQEYKSYAEKMGYDTHNLELLSFLKLLSKMKIIELYEVPKEIFSGDG